MPRDISSSSSSEDEDNSADAPPNQGLPEKTSTTKYQCPADFVTLCHKPCSSILKNNLKNNELWLIKAPSNFNPASFSGVQLPLCGLQTVSVSSADETEHTYSVLASSRCSPDFRLLSANQNSSHITLTSPFSGLLNICQNHGDSSTAQIPQIIPAVPPPSLPVGLKQRFQPGFQQIDSTLTTQTEEEDRNEGSRKRKKHKKIKTEPQEEGMQTESEHMGIQETQVMMDSEVSEDKRKKKKKKKDRERAGPPDCQVIIKTEEVTVKSEPIDTAFGDQVEGKKKKKKKKSKSDD